MVLQFLNVFKILRLGKQKKVKPPTTQGLVKTFRNSVASKLCHPHRYRSIWFQSHLYQGGMSGRA